jgi:hypothetical protein
MVLKAMQTAKTKTHTVDLLPPFTWDADKLATLEEILGEPCRIPLQGCDSWALMINAQPHSHTVIHVAETQSTEVVALRTAAPAVASCYGQRDSGWSPPDLATATRALTRIKPRVRTEQRRHRP